MKDTWTKRRRRVAIPADLTPEQKRAHLLVSLRADLVRVARLTGRPEGEAPSIEDYRVHGTYSENYVSKKLTGRRGWRKAMNVAGLACPFDTRICSERDALDDLRQVAQRLGRPTMMPTPDEYQAHGRYSEHTIRRALARGMSDPWHVAAGMAGLKPQAHRPGLTPARVLADFRRVAKQTGCQPGGPAMTAKEFEKHVPYTKEGAYRLFGGWNRMVAEAGYLPRPAIGGRRRARRLLAAA